MKSKESESYTPEHASLVDQTKEHQKQKHENNIKPFLGITLSLLSSLSLSLCNVFTRRAQLFSASDNVFISSLLNLFIMFLVAYKKGVDPLGPKEHRRMSMLRSVVLAVSIITIRISVKLISPSDATALRQLNTVMVALMARFIFNEMLSFIHVASLFMAIIGKFSYS